MSTLLSLREAAAQSGVSASRLRRLASSGVLKAQKAGAYWVVSAAALEDFMAVERPRGVRRSARASLQRDRT